MRNGAEPPLPKGDPASHAAGVKTGIHPHQGQVATHLGNYPQATTKMLLFSQSPKRFWRYKLSVKFRHSVHLPSQSNQDFTRQSSKVRVEDTRQVCCK